jgi:hypothetical protein
MKKLIPLALVLLSSCSSTQYFSEWKQEIKTDMDSKFGETYAVTNTPLSTDQPKAKGDLYNFFKYGDTYNYDNFNTYLYMPVYTPIYTPAYFPRTYTAELRTYKYTNYTRVTLSIY